MLPAVGHACAWCQPIRLALPICDCWACPCAGHDTSVCIAVTLLLVCFNMDTGPEKGLRFRGAYFPCRTEPPEPSADADTEHHRNAAPQQSVAKSEQREPRQKEHASSARGGANSGRPAKRASLDRHGDDVRRNHQQQHKGEASQCPAVSKDEIRRALAFVSGCYPHARPSRGSLRQVYNFLLQMQLGSS